jgi:hypothetical protein
VATSRAIVATNRPALGAGRSAAFFETFFQFLALALRRPLRITLCIVGILMLAAAVRFVTVVLVGLGVWRTFGHEILLRRG